MADFSDDDSLTSGYTKGGNFLIRWTIINFLREIILRKVVVIVVVVAVVVIVVVFLLLCV